MFKKQTVPQFIYESVFQNRAVHSDYSLGLDVRMLWG